MNWKKKHPGSDFLVKPHGLQSTSHETHRIGKYKQRPLGTDDESLACTNLFNPTLDCRSNVDIQADDPCEDSWGTVAHPIIPRPACYQPLPTQMSTYSELKGALDISRCNPCAFFHFARMDLVQSTGGIETLIAYWTSPRSQYE